MRIITTVSIFDEERGALKRLETLVNYYNDLGFEVRISSLCFNIPLNRTFMNKEVEFFKVSVWDMPSIIATILKGYPLSVAIYQRKQIFFNKNEKICFHLLRAVQIRKLENIINLGHLDFCESLSKNFFQRSGYIKLNLIKKIIFLWESFCLNKMERKFLENQMFSKIYFISKEASLEFGGRGIIIPPRLAVLPGTSKNYLPKVIKKIFFIGHVDYEPNLAALEHLGFELLKNKRKVKVMVCGRVNATNKHKLIKYPNLVLLGYTARPELVAKQCEVGWAFLTFGTGTQNKVYDYINWNLPSIVSRLVFNGLDQKAKKSVIIIENLQKFIIESTI